MIPWKSIVDNKQWFVNIGVQLCWALTNSNSVPCAEVSDAYLVDTRRYEKVQGLILDEKHQMVTNETFKVDLDWI